MVDAALKKKRGGQFILRIEDTDLDRFVPEAEQVIYDSLRWLGITWDEGPDRGGPYGPYRQTERRQRYIDVAEELIAKGRAYRCWCSPQRLDQMRKEQQARRQPPMYDRLCLGKTEAERKALGGYSDRPVIRILMPRDGQSTFRDAIRGEITFDNALIDDRVLVRSNGLAVYHLAAMTDDHDMRITHIVRGEEWLPSTPVHLQVFDAMGWEVPTIAHTPLILNSDRSKISKRKHAWAAVQWFRDEGFLPEAVLNYLGNLISFVPVPETPEDPNPDPSVARELFGLNEVAEYLDLAKIGPSGKILDLERLEWLNGQYIRRLPLEEFKRRVLPFMAAAGLNVADDPKFEQALPLEQERIKRLSEAPQVFSFFFRDEAYEPKLLIPRGADKPRALELLAASLETAETLARRPDEWTAETLEAAYRALAERLGLTTGKERGQLIGAGVVRVAVTGRTFGPPLFETMAILRPETVLRRMRAAIEALSAADL
jgi:glutamyl-tRNA synthetase